MKRGDAVLVALPGQFGKPRPAIIVQTDDLGPLFDSLIVCPFSSDISGAPSGRIFIKPSPQNGLEKPSIIMVEKISAVVRRRVSRVIGRLDEDTMYRLEYSLSIVLGLSYVPPLR